MQVNRLWETYDLHVGGVPVRLIEGRQLGDVGASLADRYRHLSADAGGEFLRRRLVQEPWGYEGLKAAILVPPERSSSAAGLLFMDADGFSPRCTRSLLAAALWFHEAGQAGETVSFDTPEGVQRIAISSQSGRAMAMASLPEPRAASRGTPHTVTGQTLPIWIQSGDQEHEMAFVPSPVPLDLVPEHVLTVRSLGSELVVAHRWERVVFFEAPSAQGTSARALGYRSSGTIERAVGASALAGLARIWIEEGCAAPGNWTPVQGLSAAPVEVRTVHQGSQTIAQIRGPAFPIAMRRFYESALDTVPPFLVP